MLGEVRPRYDAKSISIPRSVFDQRPQRLFGKRGNACGKNRRAQSFFGKRANHFETTGVRVGFEVMTEAPKGLQHPLRLSERGVIDEMFLKVRFPRRHKDFDLIIQNFANDERGMLGGVHGQRQIQFAFENLANKITRERVNQLHTEGQAILHEMSK